MLQVLYPTYTFSVKIHETPRQQHTFTMDEFMRPKPAEPARKFDSLKRESGVDEIWKLIHDTLAPVMKEHGLSVDVFLSEFNHR